MSEHGSGGEKGADAGRALEVMIQVAGEASAALGRVGATQALLLGLVGSLCPEGREPDPDRPRRCPPAPRCQVGDETFTDPHWRSLSPDAMRLLAVVSPREFRSSKRIAADAQFTSSQEEKPDPYVYFLLRYLHDCQILEQEERGKEKFYRLHLCPPCGEDKPAS
jgi:hypothetical protein